MPKSQFTDAYASFLEALVEARKKAGFTQVELSLALGKPQPFISNVERGVRRLDLIEFVAIARALQIDPKDLFVVILKRLPKTIEI